MKVYERMAPEGRCVSPEGHDYIENVTMCDTIPASVFCPRCGQPWTVAVFEDGDDE